MQWIFSIKLGVFRYHPTESQLWFFVCSGVEVLVTSKLAENFTFPGTNFTTSKILGVSKKNLHQRDEIPLKGLFFHWKFRGANFLSAPGGNPRETFIFRAYFTHILKAQNLHFSMGFGVQGQLPSCQGWNIMATPVAKQLETAWELRFSRFTKRRHPQKWWLSLESRVPILPKITAKIQL